MERDKNSPCASDCKDRHSGCHGECERYTEYRAAKEKEYAERLKRADAQDDIIMVIRRRQKRIRNRQGRKSG